MQVRSNEKKQVGATTCTHQSLNVIWAKELLSMQGLFISILYPIMFKVPLDVCKQFSKDADRVFSLIILISYLLAHTFNIDLARFFAVLLFILVLYIPLEFFNNTLFISRGPYGYQPRC